MINAIYVMIYLIVCIFMGIITEFFGSSKGYKYCWSWGFFLGIIGVIVVACYPSKNEASITSNNKYDNLEKLQKLKDSGTISEEEFEKEKNKLLK